MRVRQSLGLLLVLLLIALLAAACADRKDPTDTFYSAHPNEQWMETQSADFHGALVRRDGPAFCQSCHGEELMGAGQAPSCYACHNGPGGHPANWINPDPPFHGDAVNLNGPQGCRDCHGLDYQGGWTGVSCYLCHDGPAGISY